ncbi:MAG: hypothetical protein Q4F50_05710 [Bacteroides sp.]|uniref:DUF6562 domain-containing protein n=1 Tax=Bacteroides sp. TaxID=29523 RepID=UPI0026E0039D|nr:DUF6562 domain-containing protein [Bacteroides sp.]MDO5419542.1 hypothetical protein [Bacteroides sp.]
MKNRYLIPLLLLTAVLSGCVHDYPTMTPDGEEGVDPTLVEVNTEVTLDLELVPLEIITQNARSGTTKSRAGEQTEYRRRFIIEVRREGKPESRQVTVLDEAETSGGRLTLPIRLKLHAVEYTLVVWTDYVVAGTEADLYYDTENMEYISCIAPYTGSTDYRDCLYGTTALDLRQYRNEWNAKVQVKVDMVRPLAKYELIATDAKEFLAKTQKQRDAGKAYTATVAYGFYFPLGFNVLTGKPEHSEMGVTFTAPLTVTADADGECVIASDYIFVNGEESYIPLSLEIRNTDNKGISRTTGLNVPYRRGHLTTVRGRFLTNRYDAGVGIDPDFDDEDIDIDLDKLK